MKATLATIAIACLGGLAHAAPPRYDDYRPVLRAFVDANGLVDYAGLREQRGYLDDFVRYLEQLSPGVYGAWSDHDKIAFWVNAYNALTLRVIVDHYPIRPATPNGSYPVNSIRQIPGVWDRMRVHVMGEEITLQYIETKHLRRDFHDPRIHMALVCAAMSCPKLRNEPYEGAKLEAQLDDQVRDFVSNPRHVRIDRAHGVVYASEIFRWYAEDFVPGTVITKDPLEDIAVRRFAGRYLGDRAFLDHARIEYAPYDWTLNEQKR